MNLPLSTAFTVFRFFFLLNIGVRGFLEASMTLTLSTSWIKLEKLEVQSLKLKTFDFRLGFIYQLCHLFLEDLLPTAKWF